jgi:serine/threonine protein phosphatase PrpC
MSDLVAFLNARLGEDEAAANAVQDNSAPWPGQWEPRERHALQTHNGWVLAVADGHGGDFRSGVVEHIARHDPARVLRDVEARRRIIARYEATQPPGYAEQEAQGWLLLDVIRDLTAAYSDHPDYDPAWT